MKLKDPVLTFRKDINVSEGKDGEIFIQNEILSINIEKPSSLLRAFILKLAGEGASEDELARISDSLDEINGLPLFYYYLEKFDKFSIICRTLYYRDLPFATVEPVSFYFKWKEDARVKNEKFILSRFAFMRREKNLLILESPLSFCRMILHAGKSLEIIHLLNEEKTPGEICRAIKGKNKNLILTFLGILLNNGFIVKIDSEGNNQEEKNEALHQWEFHDLLFHNIHRSGRHNYPHGATYPFLKKIEPRPSYKEPMSESAIELFKPDMDKLMLEDYPFTLVAEERRTIRSFSDKPLTVEHLGEFLYRTYRIKEVKPSVLDELYDITVRPCAGGGACYELELYPIVNVCEGLSPGIYHYDALKHRLHYLKEKNYEAEILLKKAYTSAAKFCIPQVLIIITARFQRLSWKYRGMAYSTILKNVGALYQNMYLVATAMELSPCALGSGDADLLCRTAGLDYLVESPVGEFILGSKRI